MDTDATNTSSNEAETAVRRTRVTPVHITFLKAGYYVYRVKEIGSLPEDGVMGDTPVKSVPGVDYDNNEYFMVFYVCNRVDASGNTVNGVYVRNITSYANTSGDETYKPNLTDIQNVTDNGGVAAGENTARVEDDGTISHTLGKVGVSNPTTPNRLEAFRMWSNYVTHDIILKNNVTGNLGDRNKAFEYTVTLTGLAGSGTYTIDGEALVTREVSTVEIDEVILGTKNSGSSFTATEEGNAILKVKLKDDDVLVINGLPLQAQYDINEAASDHVASYTVTSADDTDGEQTSVIVSASGTNQTQCEKALSTAVETVDRDDSTVTILFRNNRDLATITGVPGTSGMTYAGIAILLAAAAYLIVRRRRRAAAEAEAVFGL